MKYTQAEAGYTQVGPTTDRLCVICRWFDSAMVCCSVVEGTIRPWGRCTRFEDLKPSDIIELLDKEIRAAFAIEVVKLVNR